MIGASKDQDIIQVNNDMQILVMAKGTVCVWWFSENPRALASPKENIPLISLVVPNQPQVVLAMLNNRNM